ncbi:hypothetical protein BU17DRAFT_70515 [Hysterangium stoloniferum]|nr:hypothetical protein BU17DRAFT_70515 [Hysterangium stoloniferum]
MTGWAALSGRIPKLKRRVKPPSTTTILETTGNVTRSVLDGTKESADAFPPLKSAVGGVIFFLDSFERLKAAREDWTLLHTRASGAELLDSKTLPEELQTMYNELMSFLTDVKAKAVDGQRRLKVKNQLQHHQDQAEQSRQLQLSGDAINRIEVVLKFTLFSSYLRSIVHKEFSGVEIGLRGLEASSGGYAT